MLPLLLSCLWLNGLCRRLAQHQSKTRKLSIMASLLAGEPSLEIWSVVPLVRPSIHPRQDSMTQDAVPAARLDKHMLRGVCVCVCVGRHAGKEHVHRHTCARSPSLALHHASITPQHLVCMSSSPCGPCSIKCDDWLSVDIKRKSHSCFQSGH